MTMPPKRRTKKSKKQERSFSSKQESSPAAEVDSDRLLPLLPIYDAKTSADVGDGASGFLSPRARHGTGNDLPGSAPTLSNPMHIFSGEVFSPEISDNDDWAAVLLASPPQCKTFQSPGIGRSPLHPIGASPPRRSFSGCQENFQDLLNTPVPPYLGAFCNGTPNRKRGNDAPTLSNNSNFRENLPSYWPGDATSEWRADFLPNSPLSWTPGSHKAFSAFGVDPTYRVPPVTRELFPTEDSFKNSNINALSAFGSAALLDENCEPSLTADTPQRNHYQAGISLHGVLAPPTPAEEAYEGVARKGCKCGKSKCTKKYCTCYNVGRPCQPGICGCKSCGNVGSAAPMISSQIPELAQVLDKHRGCRCTKSKCSQKYCDCVKGGMACGIWCKCQGCRNSDSEQYSIPAEGISGSLSESTPLASTPPTPFSRVDVQDSSPASGFGKHGRPWPCQPSRLSLATGPGTPFNAAGGGQRFSAHRGLSATIPVMKRGGGTPVKEQRNALRMAAVANASSSLPLLSPKRPSPIKIRVPAGMDTHSQPGTPLSSDSSLRAVSHALMTPPPRKKLPPFQTCPQTPNGTNVPFKSTQQAPVTKVLALRNQALRTAGDAARDTAARASLEQNLLPCDLPWDTPSGAEVHAGRGSRSASRHRGRRSSGGGAGRRSRSSAAGMDGRRSGRGHSPQQSSTSSGEDTPRGRSVEVEDDVHAIGHYVKAEPDAHTVLGPHHLASPNTPVLPALRQTAGGPPGVAVANVRHRNVQRCLDADLRRSASPAASTGTAAAAAAAGAAAAAAAASRSPATRSLSPAVASTAPAMGISVRVAAQQVQPAISVAMAAPALFASSATAVGQAPVQLAMMPTVPPSATLPQMVQPSNRYTMLQGVDGAQAWPMGHYNGVGAVRPGAHGVLHPGNLAQGPGGHFPQQYILRPWAPPYHQYMYPAGYQQGPPQVVPPSPLAYPNMAHPAHMSGMLPHSQQSRFYVQAALPAPGAPPQPWGPAFPAPQPAPFAASGVNPVRASSASPGNSGSRSPTGLTRAMSSGPNMLGPSMIGPCTPMPPPPAADNLALPSGDLALGRAALPAYREGDDKSATAGSPRRVPGAAAPVRTSPGKRKSAGVSSPQEQLENACTPAKHHAVCVDSMPCPSPVKYPLQPSNSPALKASVEASP